MEEVKTLQEQLATIVQNIGEDKIFSFDAINAIADLRVNAEALQQENTNLKEAVTKYQEVIKDKDILLEEIKDKAKGYEVREKDISDVETDKKLMEKEKEMTHARLADMKELVSLVFRNPVIKSSAFGSVPMADNNGFINSQNSSEDKTITTE